MKFATIASASVLVAASLMSATGAFAQSRDELNIAGSGTVFPFASIVAEEFSAAYPEFGKPTVAGGGSSTGLKMFCEGVGENTIDIADASRPIKDSEVEACNAAGVTDIREIQFGYDGIVFATSIDNDDFALTPELIYKAIAATVPVDGEMVANPYTNWHDIDASLPDQPIQLAIPASNHGTREVFEEKVVEAGCEEAGVTDDSCLNLRQDVVTEIAGDYTETLARLQADPNTVGVFGLSFYDQNKDSLEVATINGITPSLETIAAGDYPVSRPLYFYVKGQHIGTIPGIEEYVNFFLSDQMAGQDGRLVEAGLIPQPAEKTAEVLAAFEEGVSK